MVLNKTKDTESVFAGLPNTATRVFAAGGDIKSQFSFFHHGHMYLSHDYGDLSHADNYARYIAAVKQMKDTYALAPDIVAYDLHPGYFSSQSMVLFPQAKHIGIQHHHAHIASLLAATGTTDPIIGVSFDGTGYGSDGQVWGGEFLVVSSSQWSRDVHLRYMKMPGGEMAVHEPWRMAFSILYDTFGDTIFEKRLPCLHCEKKESYVFLKKMIDAQVNIPLTSSCGRLFDAVSSLIGITHRVSYEAEAAISLEQHASQSADECAYHFDIDNENGLYVIGYKTVLTEIIADIEKKVAREDIARRFHIGLAQLICTVTQLISNACGLKTVGLAGGVFQNKLLSAKASAFLKDAGFTVLEHAQVPVNDLGICIGQTYIALHTQ